MIDRHSARRTKIAESFAAYRFRRAVGNLAVKRHLRGRYVHISSRIVTLPVAGEDEKVDEAIRQGQYRDVVESLDAKQKPIRIARTKGLTYRRSK